MRWDTPTASSPTTRISPGTAASTPRPSSYSELDYDINFWRTKTGLEVDFVLAGGEAAIEVKGTSRVDTRDLTALSAFVEEFSPKHAIGVCAQDTERVVGSVRIMPWKRFLEKLWEGSLLQ